MYSKLVTLYILINLKITTAQYFENTPQQYYPNLPVQYYESDVEQEPEDYDNMGLDYGHIAMMTATRYGNTNYQYNDDQDCECSCNRCKKPKPCCYFSCYSCPPSVPPPPPPPANSNQNHMVFVPYPYPLTVPISVKNVTSDTSISTTVISPTTTSTTTTTEITNTPQYEHITMTNNPLRSYQHLNANAEENVLGYRNSKLLNPIPQRRTRPAWVPKYGIVPIPDQLAVKLMTQLRDVRAMQPRRL